MQAYITSISAGGLGEIIVTFEISDGENKSVSKFLISDAAYIELSLSIGASDISAYDAVERESNIYIAYKRALYALGFSSVSKKALLHKLVNKGCEVEYAREAIEASENMKDCISFTDVCEELVSKSLSFAGTLYKTCDIYDFYGCRNHSLRITKSFKYFKSLIRDIG